MLRKIWPIFFLIIIFLFPLSFSSSLFAAELTHQPIVDTITGPTSGLVGQTYTFGSSVTSVNEYSIDVVTLYSFKGSRSTMGNIAPGSDGCITTSCALSSTFTPSQAGTYTIYVGVDYYESITPKVCRSGVVSDLYDTCQNSSDKYITFIASDPQITPLVVSITGPTTGTIGEGYTFSATITGTDEIPTDGAVIRQYNSENVDGIIASIAQGDAGCTATSCLVTGTFTPTVADTYIIYVETGAPPSCSTSPIGAIPCSNSSGKYITFVVTGITDPVVDDETDGEEEQIEDELPTAGLFNNQIVNISVGLIFVSLGILTIQATNINNSITKRGMEKKKSKLENSIQ